MMETLNGAARHLTPAVQNSWGQSFNQEQCISSSSTSGSEPCMESRLPRHCSRGCISATVSPSLQIFQVTARKAAPKQRNVAQLGTAEGVKCKKKPPVLTLTAFPVQRLQHTAQPQLPSGTGDPHLAGRLCGSLTSGARRVESKGQDTARSGGKSSPLLLLFKQTCRREAAVPSAGCEEAQMFLNI